MGSENALRSAHISNRQGGDKAIELNLYQLPSAVPRRASRNSRRPSHDFAFSSCLRSVRMGQPIICRYSFHANGGLLQHFAGPGDFSGG